MTILSQNINDSQNYHPSRAIAFRTVDKTDVNSNSAPFYPQNSYGGGKLGICGFWDTRGVNSAPILGINNPNVNGVNASNEYEFYNYSPNPATGNLTANPQEVGNQYFDGNGGVTSEATLYYNDFFNTGSPAGINVQNELYQLNAGNNAGPPTQQVQAAIQAAVQEYLNYLRCAGQTTGNTGRLSSCGAGNNCSAGSGVGFPELFDPL